MKYLVKAFLRILLKAIRYSFGLMSFVSNLLVNAAYDLLKLGVSKFAAAIMKHTRKKPSDKTMPNVASIQLPKLYSNSSYTPIIIVIVIKQA